MEQNQSLSLTTPVVSPKTKLIAGIVLGGAAYLFIRKKIKQRIENAATIVHNESLQQMEVNTANTTIDSSKAAIIANGLYAAMADVGTDETAIMTLLSNRTADDLKLIVKAFGVRDYGVFGKPWKLTQATPLDLMGWFRKELSGSKLKQVEAIFTKAGIPF